jgi:diacylglycerol kinase (ATP)
MVMAGGDGTLITHLMNSKNYGINLETLVCCVLPFGTGNDFSRVTGWGGTPTEHKYYKTLKSLMNEICLNSYVDKFDVWDI